ncbi:hypothetical protein BH24ACT12_BH24ACT12_05860 [soil metagenome]
MSSPCVYELSPPMIGEVTAHGMLSLPMGRNPWAVTFTTVPW